MPESGLCWLASVEMDEIQQYKSWECRRGHVLGQVVRNASGVRQLMLYRRAISQADSADLDDVDVIAIIQGYVADVRCSICGEVRTWVPGEEALMLLLEKVLR